jgi:hypothetical protein
VSLSLLQARATVQRAVRIATERHSRRRRPVSDAGLAEEGLRRPHAKGGFVPGPIQPEALSASG